MSFKMSLDAKDFYERIEKSNTKFKYKFDLYYLSLIIGLLIGKLGSDDQLEPTAFVDEYPEQYKDKANIIAGLLIQAEMKRKGIIGTDSKSLENLFLKLLSYQSPTLLKQEGIKLLNQYAAHGWEYISEKLVRSSGLETFLVFYYKIIKAIE